MIKSIIRRSLSGFLALLIVLGTIVSVSNLPSYAATGTTTTIPFDPTTLLTKAYQYPQEKLNSMKKVQTKGDYELYVLEGSGEVAVKNVKTGQIMLTNPHDIGGQSTITDSDKYILLSQILLSFTDMNSGEKKDWNSFQEAALRKQISMTYLKNGIRIDYTLGKQDTRRVVPMLITEERYQAVILQPILEALKEIKTPRELESIQKKFEATFLPFNFEVDPKNPTPMINYWNGEVERLFKGTNVEKAWKNSKWVKKDSSSEPMAVRKVNEEEAEMILNYVENYIKSYTTYSFNEQNYDYEITGYTAKLKTSPLFKIAIEYYLQDDGSLQVRVPANSLIFDESNYMVNSISILPYMGAGSNENEGYTFIPDGSGSLIRFEDVKGINYSLVGQIFGQDFAYNTLSPSYNGKHEIMRYPVFGIIEDLGRPNDGSVPVPDDFILPGKDTIPDLTPVVTETEPETEADSETGTDTGTDTATETDSTTETETETEAETTKPDDKPKVVAGTQKKGFVAIIEEGASLAEIKSEHRAIHKYNAVYNTFYPRPTDTYNLRDAISVARSAEWSVTSDRKYTGSYRIKYIMLLTNSEGATDSKGVLLPNSKYEASYSGMAHAYRDYLIEKGLIRKLPVTDKGIPLYIESFGAIDVQDTFLSIPIWKKQALTTFGNLKTMYEQLESNGISNVIFKLTGFTNGGLDHTVPYKVKFEKVVGGNKGYKDFINYASEKGIGVYADFDFAYQHRTTAFDGFNFKKHALQSIDERYQVKREYYPTLQEFSSTGQLAISPTVYNIYFKNFVKNFSKIIDPKYVGISVSTLGTDLNSDFKKANPRNREDTRKYTEEMLANLEETFGRGIMIDGGNAYAYKYVDHILNMSLEGSRTIREGGSVPFLAMTLHGYINYAGRPTNMSSSISYEILKIIESGASPYFLLSYQNTEALKESFRYSKYYSVQYDIWLEELIEAYNILNEALKDVQFAEFISHEFFYAERIPDADEIEATLKAAEETLKKAETKYNSAVENMTRAKALYDRLKGSADQSLIDELQRDYETTVSEYKIARTEYVTAISNYDRQMVKSIVDSYYRALIDEENAQKAVNEAQRLYDKLKEANAEENDINDAKAELDAAKAVLAQCEAKFAEKKAEYEDAIKAYGKDLVDQAFSRYNKKGEYLSTVYTTKRDTVVMTKYNNGVKFLLNFNKFDITVETGGKVYTIPAYGFIKIK